MQRRGGESVDVELRQYRWDYVLVVTGGFFNHGQLLGVELAQIGDDVAMGELYPFWQAGGTAGVG